MSFLRRKSIDGASYRPSKSDICYKRPLWKKYTLLRKSHLSVIYFQYYIFLEKPFVLKTHILTYPNNRGPAVHKWRHTNTSNKSLSFYSMYWLYCQIWGKIYIKSCTIIFLAVAAFLLFFTIFLRVVGS